MVACLEGYIHGGPVDKEDLLDYCIWLGLDPIADSNLMWIAEEALRAPLPLEWEICRTEGDDDIFYYNSTTGEVSWDHPCDKHYRDMYLQEKANHPKEIMSLEPMMNIEDRMYTLSDVQLRNVSELFRRAQELNTAFKMWDNRKVTFSTEWRKISLSVDLIEQKSLAQLASIAVNSLPRIRQLQSSKQLDLM